MFYKYEFNGDYHEKDGKHEVKLIERDLDGNETAFCEGDIVPEYGIEITAEEMPKVRI
jgi:hypothetical protein